MSENLSFDPDTNTLTVGNVQGVEYTVNGQKVEGEVKITRKTLVRARPLPGYVFKRGVNSDFFFEPNVGSSEKEVEQANPDISGVQEDQPTEGEQATDWSVDATTDDGSTEWSVSNPSHRA